MNHWRSSFCDEARVCALSHASHLAYDFVNVLRDQRRRLLILRVHVVVHELHPVRKAPPLSSVSVCAC